MQRKSPPRGTQRAMHGGPKPVNGADSVTDPETAKGLRGTKPDGRRSLPLEVHPRAKHHQGKRGGPKIRFADSFFLGHWLIILPTIAGYMRRARLFPHRMTGFHGHSFAPR